MESIVISGKKFQVMIFLAFSSQLEVKGERVEATLDAERFMWRLYDNNGQPTSPIWEMQRDAQSARFEGDDIYLLKSLNDQLIRQFFVGEFLRFKEFCEKNKVL